MMEKAKQQNRLAGSQCPSIVNIDMRFILSANPSNIHIVALAGNQKTLFSALLSIKHTNYDRFFTSIIEKKIDKK